MAACRTPPGRDPAAESEIAALQELVTEVRRFRSDQGLPPGKRVPARIGGLPPALATHEAEIRALSMLTLPGEGFDTSSTLTVGGARIELDLHGAIDVAAERKRLDRDLAAAAKDLAQAQAKLGNEQFLAKAPEAVVAAIRERAVRAEADVARLTASLAAL